MTDMNFLKAEDPLWGSLKKWKQTSLEVILSLEGAKYALWKLV